MLYEFKNEYKNKNIIRALEDKMEVAFHNKSQNKTNYNSRIKRKNLGADPGAKYSIK